MNLRQGTRLAAPVVSSTIGHAASRNARRLCYATVAMNRSRQRGSGGPSMAGHTILLNLVGGVALLLWGTHMVQSAILRPSARPPRHHLPRRRIAAPGGGYRRGRGDALQSATATAMLVGSFVTRGLIALPAALALMLGADLGTTLAVQALSVEPRRADAAPAARRRRPRADGRAAARPAGRADAGRLRADPPGPRADRRRLGADARRAR